VGRRVRDLSRSSRPKPNGNFGDGVAFRQFDPKQRLAKALPSRPLVPASTIAPVAFTVHFPTRPLRPSACDKMAEERRSLTHVIVVGP
jgi:hypothetical protein